MILFYRNFLLLLKSTNNSNVISICAGETISKNKFFLVIWLRSLSLILSNYNSLSLWMTHMSHLYRWVSKSIVLELMAWYHVRSNFVYSLSLFLSEKNFLSIKKVVYFQNQLVRTYTAEQDEWCQVFGLLLLKP